MPAEALASFSERFRTPVEDVEVSQRGLLDHLADCTCTLPGTPTTSKRPWVPAAFVVRTKVGFMIAGLCWVVTPSVWVHTLPLSRRNE